MINVAVLGYGTIGSGVVQVMEVNHAAIAEKAMNELRVKYVLDLRDFPGDPVENILVHDFETILKDEDVRIVVETMGGLHPAYEFSKQCLMAGKHVCTSNKEVVATYGFELMQTARENNVNYMFEASCGGGIPIIRPMNISLSGDEVDEITGILNGTTNFILSRMEADGSDFEEVLKEAQQKGYAEFHPEADVEGFDACRKIAILSSIAYGYQIDYNDVYTEGITKISSVDMKYARAVKGRIKLLGRSRKVENGYMAMVAPFIISAESPLYNVNDVFNAIFVHGNMLGDAMFYGSGAGKLPTASAVVADVVDCARHNHVYIHSGWKEEKIELIPFGEVRNRFFVRVQGSPREKAAVVQELFGTNEFVLLDDVKDEFAFFTGRITESAFEDKAGRLPGMISRIRSLI